MINSALTLNQKFFAAGDAGECGAGVGVLGFEPFGAFSVAPVFQPAIGIANALAEECFGHVLAFGGGWGRLGWQRGCSAQV